MFIYILEQTDKIKVGKTINMQQRYKQLSSVWGEFNDNSCFFKFSLSKLKSYSLNIDNVEKTIHRLLKLKGLYLKNLNKKDGYKEFFKKDDTDIRKIIYDHFEDFILEEFNLNDIKNIHEYIDNVDIIKSYKTDKIKIHYSLILGRHNWSTNEMKIVMNAISKINKEKTLEISITKKEIETLFNENSNSKNLKDIANKLSTKKFEIQDNNYIWNNLTWFNQINYNNGLFNIHFHDDVKKYLLDLRKSFTIFNLNHILQMKSSYSIRIYQLLKLHQRIGLISFKIENLIDMFQIPKSYNYNKIKKNILLKAQEEIQEYSDMIFEFEEIKTGKKITDIKFTF